jgi:hypothetical protein
MTMCVRRLVGLGLGPLLALGICAAPAPAKSSGHPQTGRYKATPTAGAAFDFRIADRVCPRQGRGGNQHQRKGSCFVPGTLPTFDLACPSGYVLRNDTYALFNVLLTSAGKLSSPAVSSNGEIGAFHLTVDTKGHAKGYFEVTLKRPTDDVTGTTETCSTGRITFTARRG